MPDKGKSALAVGPKGQPEDAVVEPDQPAKAEPHEVNSSLSSPRMQALLEDHRRMGARE